MHLHVCTESNNSRSPDTKTYCPTSGNPLKVKDLIAVKFTPIADRDTKTATIVKQVRERIGRERGTGGKRERGREGSER